jgi:hypothetical protein
MIDLVNFFAYGDLMDEEYFKSQGLEYVYKSEVTLSAWKMVFNKIPIGEGHPEGLGLANIEPTHNNSGMMFGMNYEMKDSFVPLLDKIHDYPDQYVRKILRLNRHDFTMINGFSYIARPENVGKGLKPTKAMMKKLRTCKKYVPMLYFARLMGTKTLD